MIKYRRTANAKSLQVGRYQITLWRRYRQAGWDWENRWKEDGYVQLSWGRPMIHSRFAFMIGVRKNG